MPHTTDACYPRFLRIRSAAAEHTRSDRCLVPPSPELREKLRSEVESIREGILEDNGAPETRALASVLDIRRPKPPGLNDGLIIPGSYFPAGTPVELVRSAAADRAPLRGTVRVIVVLVDFDDREMDEDAQHFRDLFFSTGVLADGSVKEYFTEVSNGLVDITGDVVGPYRLHRDLADYANGDSGIGTSSPNARTMARDAAEAADPDVDFGPYDNDGDGFVDAFIVIHAGPGAEVTGDPDHIWSHKWVLAGGEYTADTSKIYAYLTVPEDARIGVCCHELGHLLFGWPDLYDTDGSSEGIGNWCLMAGGSWNGSGDVPAHASAWCKADQGWVSVVNHTSSGTVSISDVKTSHTVHRLWKDGGSGSEYFLMENRQRTMFDAQLPGEGLLIFHIDESISTNSDEIHPKVALEQGDGADHLGSASNRGDDGDPYPGGSDNRTFDQASTPSSRAYNGADTCVAVTNISDAGPVMTARVRVSCKTFEKPPATEKGASKEIRKEMAKEVRKEIWKEKEGKEKDWKDKEWKEKELKEREKSLIGDKRPEKPEIDKGTTYDKNPITEKQVDKPKDGWPGGGGLGGGGLGGGGLGGWDLGGLVEELRARITALEATLGAAEPFIGRELRPDLRQGALAAEEDAELQKQMAEGSAGAKRSYDSKPLRP